MLVKDLFSLIAGVYYTERILLGFNDINALSNKKKTCGGESVRSLRS